MIPAQTSGSSTCALAINGIESVSSRAWPTYPADFAQPCEYVDHEILTKPCGNFDAAEENLYNCIESAKESIEWKC